jgi:hypothetical protein
MKKCAVCTMSGAPANREAVTRAPAHPHSRRVVSAAAIRLARLANVLILRANITLDGDCPASRAVARRRYIGQRPYIVQNGAEGSFTK